MTFSEGKLSFKHPICQSKPDTNSEHETAKSQARHNGVLTLSRSSKPNKIPSQHQAPYHGVAGAEAP